MTLTAEETAAVNNAHRNAQIRDAYASAAQNAEPGAPCIVYRYGSTPAYCSTMPGKSPLANMEPMELATVWADGGIDFRTREARAEHSAAHADQGRMRGAAVIGGLYRHAQLGTVRLVAFNEQLDAATVVCDHDAHPVRCIPMGELVRMLTDRAHDDRAARREEWRASSPIAWGLMEELAGGLVHLLHPTLLAQLVDGICDDAMDARWPTAVEGQALQHLRDALLHKAPQLGAHLPRPQQRNR